MDEMMRKIDHYFDTVSDEQLWADARAAGFRIVPKSPRHTRLADWLCWRIMDAAALIDWRIWHSKVYQDVTGQSFHEARITTAERALLVFELLGTTADGLPYARWDGWQPGRYV